MRVEFESNWPALVAYINQSETRGEKIGGDVTAERPNNRERSRIVKILIRKFWIQDEGQDIAEYAVMLAVIRVIVFGTIRLIGSYANNVFSSVSRAIQ